MERFLELTIRSETFLQYKSFRLKSKWQKTSSLRTKTNLKSGITQLENHFLRFGNIRFFETSAFVIESSSTSDRVPSKNWLLEDKTVAMEYYEFGLRKKSKLIAFLGYFRQSIF